MGTKRGPYFAVLLFIATACGRLGYPVVRRDASLATDATAIDGSPLMDRFVESGGPDAAVTDADRIPDAAIDVIDAFVDASSPASDSSITDAAADASRPRVLNAVRVFAPPGENFRPSSIATDVDGNVYLTATIFEDQDFGSGTVTASASATLVLASYDPVGGPRWQRVLRSTNSITAVRASAIGDGVTGSLLLTGSIEGMVTVPSSTPLSAPVGTPTWMHYSVTTAGVHRFAAAYPGPSSTAVGTLAANGTIDVASTGAFIPLNLGLGNRTGHIHVARFDAANAPTVHRTISWSGSGSYGVGTPRRVALNTIVAVNGAGQFDFGSGPVGSGTITPWGFVAEYTPTGAYVSQREFSVVEAPLSSVAIIDVVAENDLRCIVVSYTGRPLSFSAPDGPASFVDCQHSTGGSSWSVPFTVRTAHLYGSRLVLGGTFSGDLDFGLGELHAGATRDTLIVTYEISSAAIIHATNIESPASDDFPISTAIDPGRARLWVLADYEGATDLNGTIFDSGSLDHAWLAWVGLPP